MGMIHSFLRVSPAELEEYRANAGALEERVFSGEDEPMLTDIDKSWDGIIFLLTGERFTGNHPLVGVFFSGVTFDDDQDMGYGLHII